jgi:hypothetical protein
VTAMPGSMCPLAEPVAKARLARAGGHVAIVLSLRVIVLRRPSTDA